MMEPRNPQTTAATAAHQGRDALRDGLVRALLDNTAAPVVAITPDCVIVAVNRAAGALLKAAPEEIAGRPLSDAVPAWADTLSSLVEKALSRNIPVSGRLQAYSRECGRRVEVRVEPLAAEGEPPAGALAFFPAETERAREAGLWESGERFWFRNAPAMLHLMDSEGRLVDVSERWLQSTGHSRWEVVGRKAVDFMTPQSRRLAEEAAWPLFFRRGYAQNVPFRFVRKDGGKMDVLSSAVARWDEKGRIVSALVVLTERMENREVEAALTASEARFRALFDQMTGGIVIFEPVDNGEDFVIKDCNRAGERISGAKRRDLIGLPVTRAFPGVIDSGLLAVFQTVFFSGVPQHVPETYYEDDDRGLWIENHVFSLPSGEIVSVFSDVTEKRKAEIALVESEDRFRKLFEGAPLGYQSLDGDGRFLLVNDSWLALTGYRRSEVVGRRFTEFLPEKYHHRFETGFPKFKEAGVIEGTEFELLRKDGSRVLAAFYGRIATDENGDFVQTHCILRDVTARRRMDRMLKEQERRSRQAQKLEALSVMAGGIAHEFNNVLGIIIGNAEMALDDSPPFSQASGNIEQILTAAFRAEKAVRALLSFSRKAMPDEKPVRLSAVVSSAVETVRASAPPGVEVREAMARTDDWIRADPYQIRDVVLNLCANAIEAMGEAGGVLTVGVQPDEEGGHGEEPPVTLYVEDTGPGIPEAILPRIFDPYFTTRGPFEAAGMGLAVVDGIVKRHGGEVRVSSRPGEGARFEARFPGSNHGPEAPEIDDAATESTARGRVLFVDDETALADIAGKGLIRSGFSVEVFTSPTAALSRFTEAPDDFDAVITDMVMPGMNGDELARRIRKVRPNVPVALITGYSEKLDGLTATDAGVDILAFKPMNRKSLSLLATRLLHDSKF